MGAYIARLIASIAFRPPVRSVFDYWRNPEHAALLDLPAARVRVPMLFVPYPRAMYTVLYSHGNATHVIGMQSIGRIISEALKCNFVAFEYPGYTDSAWMDPERTDPLLPSESSTLEAAECALLWLIERERIDPRSIVLYGNSLGSGPAVHLAVWCAQRGLPVGGLILQSPIASAFRVLMPCMYRTLPFDIFANIDKIGGVRCRVAIMHGTGDRVVPIANAHMLAKAVPPELLFPPLYIEGANHNDIESLATAAWLGYVRNFMQQLMCE